MNLALDAMGGDYAPDAVIQGAVEAVSELDVHVTLVGNERIVRRVLDRHPPTPQISIHHCEEVVEMHESPMKALRTKKDSSILVAFKLVKEKQAQAVISAGNSGAMLAAGLLVLGRMRGVERPAIAGIFPTEKGPVVLLDVGANVDCRPGHLYQFGVMAQAFSSGCLGVQEPKIGLLNIGEEGGKGNEQVRLAHELFRESRLNFVGNVEGRDIFTCQADVVVCDGFVGNVALKVTEGLVDAMTRQMEKELAQLPAGQVTPSKEASLFKKLKQKFDYEEYGGAPLLGINGVGVVCHGGSSPKAIRNAVKLAAQYVGNQVLEKMGQQLQLDGMEQGGMETP